MGVIHTLLILNAWRKERGGDKEALLTCPELLSRRTDITITSVTTDTTTTAILRQ